MSKIIGLLVVVGVLVFGAYSYMGWTEQSETPEAPAVVDPIVMPEAPVETEEQEAIAVEEAMAPSDATDVKSIENDADIVDIENDLDGLGDLEAGLDTL